MIDPKLARKRYNRDVLLLMALYALILFAAAWLFKHHRPQGLLAYVLGIAPALPVIGVFALVGRYFSEEPDAYLRMLMVRQALIATGFALSVATAWGFLESFDLVPHVDAYAGAILWFFGLGLGGCWNRIRSA